LKIACIVYPLCFNRAVAKKNKIKIVFSLLNEVTMQKKYNHALHLFRRDLRLVDNTALYAAADLAEKVSVGFIFDPKQVDTNKYKSFYALAFMVDSLKELAQEVDEKGGVFNFWYAPAAQQLSSILSADKDIDVVMVNADYTPFSVMRDAALAEVCKKHRVDFVSHHDALLNPPGTVLTGNNTMFKIFTPFYKAALHVPMQEPRTRVRIAFSDAILSGALKKIPAEIVAQCQEVSSVIPGGRAAALEIMKKLAAHNRYSAVRDFPSLSGGTTQLSAHNKFGTVSVREFCAALKEQLGTKAEPLIRSLYWRDFFCHVAYDHPRVFGHAYNEEYDDIVWDNNKTLFAAWCEGKTGFPLVDAGMRQLNETGFMHNRVRMVTASLLIKDLHIDWQWGERYFAQKLVDYDPAVNNGNWQWVASTGCDSQPYFRIFNPWLQQKKFDSEAEYIKRWVPELRNATAAQIHNIDKKAVAGYCRPIVDHAVESKKALMLYKQIKG